MKKEAVYHFCRLRYMSAHRAGGSRDSGVSYAPVSLVLSVAGVIQLNVRVLSLLGKYMQEKYSLCFL